ncbi:MAG: tyrosine protein phosphatase, partial [Deltaproteobacteria bacterium]|nr:tyrosine protein phosphatase [Deltaproteobacteria bacterium]
MARIAVRDGIQGVVCTPHWVPGQYENTRTKILKTLNEFRKKLEEHGIPLITYPGAELRLDVSLIERLKDGELLTLNDTGRYVLIELPQDSLPPNLDRFFWDIRVTGMTPIISHPERNLVLRNDPQILYRWVETGVLTQLTASSLLGRFG